MPIPTELVGSLPRPLRLQETYEALDQGQLTFADLQREQDAAAADSIRRLETTGETYLHAGYAAILHDYAPRMYSHAVMAAVRPSASNPNPSPVRDRACASTPVRP